MPISWNEIRDRATSFAREASCRKLTNDSGASR